MNESQKSLLGISKIRMFTTYKPSSSQNTSRIQAPQQTKVVQRATTLKSEESSQEAPQDHEGPKNLRLTSFSQKDKQVRFLDNHRQPTMRTEPEVEPQMPDVTDICQTTDLNKSE